MAKENAPQTPKKTTKIDTAQTPSSGKKKNKHSAEEEEEPKVAKVNKTPIKSSIPSNTLETTPKDRKSKKKQEESESDSDSDSSSDDSSSDSSSESESPKTIAKATPKKQTPPTKAPQKDESDSDSSSDESDDSSDDSSDESSSDNTNAKKQPAKASQTVSKKPKQEDSSEDDSSDDSDDESSGSSDEETPEPPKKQDIKPAVQQPKAVPASQDNEENDFEETKPAAVFEEKKAFSSNAQKGNESASLFVGGLSMNTTSDNLFYAFEKVKATDARVIMDKQTNTSKRFGYIDFASSDDAKAALEQMNGFELDGRTIRLDYANAPSSSPPPSSSPRGSPRPSRGGFSGDRDARPPSEPSECLFVGQLSYGVDNDVLRDAFASYNPTSVRVMSDKFSGKSKGFGYVDFSSVDEAKKAFEEMNGQDVSGRRIKLDFAKPSGSFSSGGGGGGGFSSGGGRGGRGGRGFGRGGRGGGFGGGFGGGRGGRGGGAPRGGVPRAEGTGTSMTFGDDDE